jgi:hypothetical protein
MERFEFHSYGHALEILTESFPLHWYEICQSLNGFGVTTNELLEAGGNETAIPGKFDAILYPLGWREMKITGDLLIKMYPRKVNQRGRFSDKPFDEKTIEGWIDGHNIDFIKDKVAFDLEWNSKDQTFDRDLLAMRTYFDCGIIDVGVIVTRSEELNEVFRALKDAKGSSLIKKYGASTTWMGKLLPRLNSRRNGGCPILAVGIRKPCVIDWKEAK